ncbi:lipocalin-15 isoform X2 [Camelus ferus]|uniref:Lipocalin-15 isoform X2 n=1 Tax=Camelus ferus TaxID=419612 RepID=A0A8B8SYA6_CAMFR|nr:lipocalin-15 isoform X1 [Camelus dromedarius]XP_032334829.1 lipocalin-15 isoform X2 [Camelus ferus]
MGQRMGMWMRAALLSCVLALLQVSAAQAEVLLQPDFDAKKGPGARRVQPACHRAVLQFSGLWYVVSMVSDCKVFWGKKDHLLMSTREINATEEGNLSVHMEFPGADGCNQVDAEYLRTGSQGHFRVPALGYLDVRIVEMDYSSFAVVYIYKELEGAFSTMVQLYSEDPQLPTIPMEPPSPPTRASPSGPAPTSSPAPPHHTLPSLGPAETRPDPGSESPGHEGLPGLLPDRGAPRCHEGHAAQVRCVLPRGQGCTMTLLETHLGSSQVELEQQALAPQLPSCPDSRPSWPCTSPTPILHGTSP